MTRAVPGPKLFHPDVSRTRNSGEPGPGSVRRRIDSWFVVPMKGSSPRPFCERHAIASISEWRPATYGCGPEAHVSGHRSYSTHRVGSPGWAETAGNGWDSKKGTG